MKGAAFFKKTILRGTRFGMSLNAGWALPSNPRSIFIQRCNDLGDVLIITPLFEALRRRFPETEIVAGVGPWSVPLLEGNPYLSSVLPLHLPWHNKYLSDQSKGAQIRYLLASAEIEQLRHRRFEVGIDILGSFYGALMLWRAGIPHRIGVEGYAGGDGGYQRAISYCAGEHVGRSALRFAELWEGDGALAFSNSNLPENRPQVFLNNVEKAEAEALWISRSSGSKREQDNERERPRIVIAPSAGFSAKAWPAEHYRRLVSLLAPRCGPIFLIGGQMDVALGEGIRSGNENVTNLAGRLSLRQTLAVLASANAVVCNSSMAMHGAAAFRVPTLVLLGDFYPSALEHARQWGYPDAMRILGKEPGKSLPDPEEAKIALLALLDVDLFD